jgi:hypothetical protein
MVVHGPGSHAAQSSPAPFGALLPLTAWLTVAALFVALPCVCCPVCVALCVLPCAYCAVRAALCALRCICWPACARCSASAARYVLP